MSDGDPKAFAEQIADRIRDALDMDPGETLTIQTPTFDRQDGIEPGTPPLTEGSMDALVDAGEAELKELGLKKWSDDTGVWLLPHDWHPHIPADYPLVNIFGEGSSREELPANPDKRFGVLSVGIVPAFEEGEADD